MAFDGIFLHSSLKELDEAVGCHIDKIYQPSRDELVFLLRKKGFAKRLLMCVRSGSVRLQLTEKKYENPAVPPMLCMLVRKHFSAARLMSVVQHGFDRVVKLCFEATNEMGDRVNLSVICELIGNNGNIIFTFEDGRIIDAMRRSDIEKSERIIQPGAFYEYPVSSGKLSFFEDTEMIVSRIIQKGELPLWRAVLDSLEGVSPLVAREIAQLSGGLDILTGDCDAETLQNAVAKVKGFIDCGKPTMLCDKSGTPVDFSYMPIIQYEGLYFYKSYESFSVLLDDFYAEREAAAFIKHAAGDVVRLVDNLITRAGRRCAERKKELEGCRDCEKMRISGELIKANIHLIKSGAESITVQNFYDEDLSDITIRLNPALSPSANAARYFKGYKKSHTAAGLLEELIKKDGEEILYLESVRESINRCKTVADISEIRDELRREGYIKAPQKRTSKTPPVAFLEHKSVEGFKILVGKNNTQNDLLTTKIASKGDMWFHTKGVPGSHVVVFCDGKPISDETIILAATLAASNSKASTSSNVAVDYTPIKFVKKPSGAKAGMVIYTTNKTVFVTPEKEKLQ